MTDGKTDTRNKQGVGVTTSDHITVFTPKAEMTPEEALCHAAWLVRQAESLVHEGAFEEILLAVRSI